MQDILSEEELEQQDNNAVLQMLEDGISIRRLQENEGFKLIDRACKRIAEDAKRKLLTIEARAENLTAIIELQIMAKLYGNVLDNIKQSYITVGNMAFEEAKIRELIKAPENDG